MAPSDLIFKGKDGWSTSR